MSESECGLRVLDPGLSTTVQDLGRPGHRAFGVPVGGAFDLEAHVLANALAGNEVGAATLELTLRGGCFETVGAPLALAIVGAPMSVLVGPREVLPPCSFTLEPGQRLTIGGATAGARAYLAVAGGWLTEPVLGSRSDESRLKAGAVLAARGGRTVVRRLGDWTGLIRRFGCHWSSTTSGGLGLERSTGRGRPVAPGPGRNHGEAPSSRLALPRSETGPIVLRAIDGPDAAPGWWDTDWRVSAMSDRAGVRLEGPELAVESPTERLSAPVAPGAVQVAGGRPIILGPAGGTMGGYPHVAHVISADLPALAQMRPGAFVCLERIEWEAAVGLDRACREDLSRRCLIIRAATSDRHFATTGP